MRIAIWLLSAWLSLSAAFADGIQIPWPPIGQIPGTTTNDNACAGCVGEYVESSTAGSASATATITIATPGVITITGNAYTGVAAIVFTTSGALPTGITSGTTYYTSCPLTAGTYACGDSFKISTTVANALAGTFIATSGSQSGTHTAVSSVALTNNTAIDVGGISLTAGNWDIWLGADLNAATTTVQAGSDLSISTTTATRNGTPTMRMARYADITGAGTAMNQTAGPYRVSITSTTTYFGVLRGVFSVSTLSYTGMTMRAVRIR